MFKEADVYEKKISIDYVDRVCQCKREEVVIEKNNYWRIRTFGTKTVIENVERNIRNIEVEDEEKLRWKKIVDKVNQILVCV